ncbi:MAG: NADH-quinone oxidoreductase subunit NuoE [Syntrophobacterales bacterium]|jgi:NADH-quinone oxidoreductase subunit E|nr:NADH-quinone oxidoreductase subunit NuoE [Syntrophobacterales bacterium]
MAPKNAKQKQGMDRFSKFKAEVLKSRDGKGVLIPLLQSAQETYGYIPESAINLISKAVGIPTADIYGVVTFYSQFRLKPMGKNIIKVCDGTACHVNSSTGIIRALESELNLDGDETTDDGLFTVQKVACLGCCSLSPVLMINDETHGRLNPKKVQQILKEYKGRESE